MTTMPDAAREAVPSDYPFPPRYLRLPEGLLHYVDEGRGDPIVFVHGTPTWSYDWRHLISSLSPRFRCIAPDLLGFGHSDRPASFAYSPQAHAAVIQRFVDALSLERFTLVVHDFGGPIALPLALDQPSRITRLALINTWMWGFGDDRQMQQRARVAASAVGRLLYRYANFSLRVLVPSVYGDRGKLTQPIHRAYLDRFPDFASRERVLWALVRALDGSRAYYDGLWARRDQLRQIPTMVLWGLKDSAFQPHMLQRWRTALPEARVVELPDSGHWPHEEEPDRVLAEFVRFLDELGNGAPKGG
jgi:haloalkane dehalogenase